MTIKLGGLLINGMRNLVSFVCFESKTCIGEFTCDGRVDRIELSNDKKEIFIYTDKCKFYRIQMNETEHFMNRVENSSNTKCFVPIFEKD